MFENGDIVMNINDGKLGIIVGMSWNHHESRGWLRVKFSDTFIIESNTSNFELIKKGAEAPFTNTSYEEGLIDQQQCN